MPHPLFRYCNNSSHVYYKVTEISPPGQFPENSIRHLSVRNLLIQIFKIIYLSYLLNYVRIVSFRKPSTAWKVSKYRVISGPYFPVFSPNTGQYGPEITPYLDTFHAVTYFLVTYLIVSKGEKHLALFGIKH